MMRRLWLSLALLVTLAAPLHAQPVGQPQSITVVDSGVACQTAPAACAIYALDNQTGGLTLSIFGTWTGTLSFEGTNNDGIWTAVLATNVATGAQASTTTTSGLFTITNVGVIKVRVRATAAITGTAQVTAAKGLGFARSGGGTGTFAGNVTSGGTISSVGSITSGDDVTTGSTAGSQFLCGTDGTAAAPCYSWASEQTLGLWRSAAGTITAQGIFAAANNVTVAGNLTVTGGSSLNSNTTVTGIFTLVAVAFASLGTPGNGSFRYCSDCTIANPCAGSGTGALAKRLGGIWVCN